MQPLPQPPQPHFAPPYPLQEHFAGRTSERQTLSEWWAFGDVPVLAVLGSAGMGKSALAWAWVQRDVLDIPLPGSVEEPPVVSQACRVAVSERPDGVLWWCFQEPKARFEAFLDEALAYLGGPELKPAEILSGHEKVEVLLTLLRERRYLLVLDALELELRGYAGLSVGGRGDTTLTDDARVDFRTCADVHAASFLRRAATSPLRSRLLLTGRVLPHELDGQAGVRRQRLKGLAPDDAVSFFQAQGVRGTKVQIRAACEAHGYHPLSLRLLAGLIVNDSSAPGAIAVAGKSRTASHRVPSKHRILAIAYDALPAASRELLSRLAAFRTALEYGTIESTCAALRGGGGLAGGLRRMLGHMRSWSRTPDVRECLNDLVRRGLLLFDQQRKRCELHPLVRRYAYRRLTDKPAVHDGLRAHLSAAMDDGADPLGRIQDLAPLIEFYYHTVRAGRYDEAFHVCHDRLLKPLLFRFRSYATCVGLLQILSPAGEGQLPRLAAPADQYWALNALASSFALCGQPQRAVAVFQRAVQMAERIKAPRDHAISLGNMAHQQLLLGELTAAELNLRAAIEFGRGLGDYEEALGQRELGQLLYYKGDFGACAEVHERTLRLTERCGNRQVECVLRTHSVMGALSRGNYEAALDEARGTHELSRQAFAGHGKFERDMIRAEWLLAAALLACAEQKPRDNGTLLDEAATHLRSALVRCRRVNLLEIEPDILLSVARWYRLRGDRPQACDNARAALGTAERCDFRLKQAEIHCLLARLALDSGDQAAGRRHAEAARERAWCDGPPNCYKLALEEAAGLRDEASVVRTSV
ncbi:MAG: hypothetical protein KKB50_00035 [Planctomycetes bacterium]|nr:hypothetical protein [Planctomycetota bacterium]